MSNLTKFFFTGATGYIGSIVLERFLDHPNAATFEFSTLVRTEDKADKLKKLGVQRPVLGKLQDLSLIEEESARADVIVNMADCDDLEAAEAILRGTKTHFENTGKQSILIHTSGTGVLIANTRGLSDNSETYDDMNPEQIETLAPTQIHRNVDTTLDKADKEGYVKTYIILPPTVYGLATGKLSEVGISNIHSIQTPLLIRAAIERGTVGMIGDGKNKWPSVEVHELGDLYISLYNSIVEGKNKACGHGREGYYFGSSGDHYLFLDILNEIGRVLHKIGKVSSPIPAAFNQEEIVQYMWGTEYLGSTSKCIPNRAKAIGWNPKKMTADFIATVEKEVETLLVDGYVPSLTDSQKKLFNLA